MATVHLVLDSPFSNSFQENPSHIIGSSDPVRSNWLSTSFVLAFISVLLSSVHLLSLGVSGYSRSI